MRRPGRTGTVAARRSAAIKHTHSTTLKRAQPNQAVIRRRARVADNRRRRQLPHTNSASATQHKQTHTHTHTHARARRPPTAKPAEKAEHDAQAEQNRQHNAEPEHAGRHADAVEHLVADERRVWRLGRRRHVQRVDKAAAPARRDVGASVRRTRGAPPPDQLTSFFATNCGTPYVNEPTVTSSFGVDRSQTSNGIAPNSRPHSIHELTFADT